MVNMWCVGTHNYMICTSHKVVMRLTDIDGSGDILEEFGVHKSKGFHSDTIMYKL